MLANHPRLLLTAAIVAINVGCAAAPTESPAPDVAPPPADGGLAPDAGAVAVDGGHVDGGHLTDGGDAVVDDGGSIVLDSGAPSPDDAGASVADPFAPGPYTFDTSTSSVARGDRTTPVRLHLPDGIDNPPLVVFAPGFRVDSAHYAPLHEHLLSHGIAVAAVDPEDPLLSVSHRAMADDVVEVVRTLTSSAPFAHDDVRVVLAGHSLGGKVSVMAAAAADVDIAAVVALDPVNGGSPITGYSEDLPDIVPDVVAALQQPLLFVGETTNAEASGFTQACAPAAQNFTTFFDAATSSSWAVSVDVIGADHMDFVDDAEACGFVCGACEDGTVDATDVQHLTRGLVLTFIEAALDTRPMGDVASAAAATTVQTSVQERLR